MKRMTAYLLLLPLLLSCAALRNGTASGGNTRSKPESGQQEVVLTREVGEVDPPVPAKEGKKGKTTESSTSNASEQAETPLSDQVIAYARTFLGTPYKLGASGPKLFDCSGFTRYVFKHFGYQLTQYSGAQYQEGREVSGYGDLQKGDLVFFGKRGSVRNIGHVGIVVSINEERGSFRFIHASTSGGVVESESTQAYYMMRYIGARRILPDEPRK